MKSTFSRLFASKWTWLILAMLAALAMVLAINLKREPYLIWTHEPSQQQLNKHGDLLALSLFYHQQFPQLSQQAWRSWKKDEPSFGNEQQHLLFINDAHNMTATQFTTLLSWVNQGNHVVMPVYPSPAEATPTNEPDSSENDPFQPDWSRLEDVQADTNLADVNSWAKLQFVHRDWHKLPALAQTRCAPIVQNIVHAHERTPQRPNVATATRKNWLQECANNLSTLTLPEGKSLYWLNSGADAAGFTITPSKSLLWQSKGAAGSHIARIQHGKGTVVLVNAMNPLGNPSDPRNFDSDLNRADHAYVAAYLAQNKQAVWFIDRINVPAESTPPLWQLLWRFSPLFCLTLLMLFVLFVWRVGKRQGVMKTLSQHENRQLRQYLQAQGEFLWHQQNRQHTLSQLQQQLWQEWQHRVPGLSTMKRPEQLAALRKIINVPVPDLELWLQPLPTQANSKQWLAYLQAHQHIRNAT